MRLGLCVSLPAKRKANGYTLCLLPREMIQWAVPVWAREAAQHRLTPEQHVKLLVAVGTEEGQAFRGSGPVSNLFRHKSPVT